jgi:hypothetical protein
MENDCYGCSSYVGGLCLVSHPCYIESFMEVCPCKNCIVKSICKSEMRMTHYAPKIFTTYEKGYKERYLVPSDPPVTCSLFRDAHCKFYKFLK